MRQTRFEYRSTLRPNRLPKQSVPEVMAKLKREVRRRLEKDGVISKKQPYEFHWECSLAGKSYGGIVETFSRGQARGLIKQSLGVSSLPKNLHMIRVEPRAATPTFSISDASIAA